MKQIRRWRGGFRHRVGGGDAPIEWILDFRILPCVIAMPHGIPYWFQVSYSLVACLLTYNVACEGNGMGVAQGGCSITKGGKGEIMCSGGLRSTQGGSGGYNWMDFEDPGELFSVAFAPYVCCHDCELDGRGMVHLQMLTPFFHLNSNRPT